MNSILQELTEVAHRRIGTPFVRGTKITVSQPLKQYLVKAKNGCRSEVEKRNVATLGKVL